MLSSIYIKLKQKEMNTHYFSPQLFFLFLTVLTGLSVIGFVLLSDQYTYRPQRFISPLVTVTPEPTPACFEVTKGVMK